MLTWDELTRLATLLHGIPVLGCRPGSPAARAGVKYGDILTMVNDVPTPDWTAYVEARARDRGQMRIELFRAGETLVIECALTPAEPVDPAELLEELLDSGVLPRHGGTSRPAPEPS
jgi:S1-C subfamily serine protease